MTTTSPRPLKPHEISPRHGQQAGIISRGGAALIDYGVVWAAGTAIAFSLTLIQSVLNDDVQGLDLNGVAAFLAGTSLLVFYLWVAWGLGGRTIGQVLLGLRVQRVGGGSVGGLRALGRAWLATYLPVLLFISVVSRRSAAAWDLLLGTEVVYDWEKSTPKPR
jgi:uncharacterized RDD family membrane protein YckC